MAILPLIPFFLGYSSPIIFGSTPSYLFHVRVDTLFINKSGRHTITKNNAGLEFYLRCQPHKRENLKCHIPKTISYTPSTDPIHIVDNNVFTPSSLQFSGLRYRMEFDNKGVTGYHFLARKVKNKETLLEIYRFIGDQLSVGANLSPGNFEFHTMENTVIGECPTYYKISPDKALNRSKFELVSSLASQDYTLYKDKAFLIRKQRRMGECHSLNSYILGRILWTDLLPSNVTANPTQSITIMSFARNNFYSKTVNTLVLNSEQDKTDAYVLETINVKLDFVED